MTLLCARPGCEVPVRRSDRQYCSPACWQMLFKRQQPPSRYDAAFRATLAELWATSPLSAAGLARQLKLSKNQLIGLVHRLGLPGREPPANLVHRTKAHRALTPPKPKRMRAPRVTLPPLRPQPVVRQPAVVVPFPAPSNPFCTCQYALNDGRPWRFCEVPTASGSSYCAVHTAVCYHRRPLREVAA